MAKSIGGRAPTAARKLQIYQLNSTIPTFISSTPSSSISTTSIWRGSTFHFPGSTPTTPALPKPFSYQIYITTLSLSHPSFPTDLFSAVLEDISSYESWRLDIYDASALGWSAQECVAHYRALEAQRRGQAMHTVRSYYGDTPWGCRFRGMLFMVDGEGEGWKGEKGVRCVQFDKGREGDEEELEEGDERRWGTVVRDSRMGVEGTEARQRLGGWLENIWGTAECRGEYEVRIGVGEGDNV